MLGKKIERTKKPEKDEKVLNKEADLKEIKRKMDVEKEKQRRLEVQRKNLNQQQTQEVLAPNNTLFVENLNANVTETILNGLFSQHTGFK